MVATERRTDGNFNAEKPQTHHIVAGGEVEAEPVRLNAQAAIAGYDSAGDVTGDRTCRICLPDIG
jgi:hypothetical protein